MTTTTLPQSIAEPRTPEWFERRRNSITGSDIAAAVGLHEESTAREAYERKIGNLPEDQDNRDKRRGRYLEPFVVDDFCEQTGKKIIQFPCGLYQHPEHDWIVGTPDALLEGEELLEAKTTVWQVAKRLGDEQTADVFPQWVIQTQWYLEILGWNTAHVAVLIDAGYTLRTFTIERNDRLIAKLIDAGREFRERIVNRDPPPLDFNHKRTPELVAAMYGSVGDKEIVRLSPEAVECWKRAARRRERIKELERRNEADRARVLSEIGEHYGGSLGNGRMVRRIAIKETEVCYTRKAFVQARETKLPK